jgi:RNA polymerase sigma factor (sigma-70 family)
MSTAPDNELLARARTGDDSAYEELWQRNWHRAVAIARSLSKSQDPEDVAAEAFTRILIALRSDRGPTVAFAAYLRATIHNIVVRAASTRRDYAASNGLLDSLLGPADSAETTAISLLQQARLARALASLPPRWREALVFDEIYGLPPREWGPLMGLTPRAATALARRARAGLRTVWLSSERP